MARWPGSPQRLSRALVSGAGLLLLAVVMMRTVWGSCAVDPNMRKLLGDVSGALAHSNFTYWIDYGTLLGAMREGHLIPWEFDVDLGIQEEECERLMGASRSLFGETGYRAVNKGEYMWEKKLMHIYDPTETGTLRALCTRVYFSHFFGLYVDIYWYRRVRTADIPRAGWRDLGEDVDDWRCTYEGLVENDPQGCKPTESLLPRGRMRFEGMDLPIPHDPVRVLDYEYGRDSWRVPMPKGYKAVVCTAGASTLWFYFFIWLASLVAHVRAFEVPLYLKLRLRLATVQRRWSGGRLGMGTRGHGMGGGLPR